MPDDAAAASPGRSLRLATWNMNHWQTPAERRAEGWAWLRGAEGLDVALLQETVPPASVARERIVYREIGGRCPWGSAVVALGDGVEVEEVWSVAGGSRYRHRIATAHPGSVVVARVTVPGVAPITAVSLYNLLEGSPAANLLRVAADLLPLLDAVEGERVIVGGDLNVYGAVASARRSRTAALFELLDGLGLHRVGALEGVEVPPSATDCPCGRGGTCGHVPTWKGFDLDQVFVSDGLRSQVRSLAVERSVVERGLSDHAALVLGMELSAAPVPRAWDAETLIEEVASLHGPGAAGVVAAIVEWSARSEDRLRAAGFRDRRLTDYEFPRAVQPTMYLGLTFRDPSCKPQWLVAVHAASGALDISFQYMSHPPFDTEAGREPLRQLLNAIPAVAIPAARLRGRPRLPLAVFSDSQSLSRLLAVLDRVVDETAPGAAGHPSAPGVTTCEGMAGPDAGAPEAPPAEVVVDPNGNA